MRRSTNNLELLDKSPPVDDNTLAIPTTAFVIGQAASASPLAAATASAAGSSTRFARADHVHPGSSGHFVGESIIWHGLALPGYSAETWGWTDGSAVSRTTYAALLTAITVAQAGSTTNGSAVVTGLASTAGFATGMAVEGVGIPSSTTILSVNSLSQITLSATATATGTPTVTVLPWGNGNGTTTFNLPDSRGRNWVGLALSGGHADVSGMGLTDNLAATLRRAKHRHSNATALSGAPALGSLTVSGAPAIGSLGISGAPALGSLTVTGAPSVGTLTLPNHAHSDDIQFTVIAQMKGTLDDSTGNPYLMFPFSGGHDADESTTKSGGVQGVASTPAINGAPGAGSLAVGGAPGAGSLAVSGAPAVGSLAVAGAPGVGSLAVAGLIGNSSSDSLDAAPYAVVGKPIRMA